ncbi:mitogen-activated protein kinase kinase 9-like [Telopea speciosissima]|uniref:mitogen-activated protein kinase kinase 9-like n=1 Tax=Telopea speciosissima TaxID=54955 RepID=UPI001CC3D4AB|nr:mitogen-activated protein kinase kinase 9-like [Telopea speciosissima]
MEVVRQRRNHNLRLFLPDSSTQCRPHFPLPFPPTSSFSATTISQQEVDCLSDLEKLKVLGHGNGGTVYQVRHNHTSNIYALKVIRGNSDTTVHQQILNEMEILRHTDSPFIVRCNGIFHDPSGDTSILMEYMDGGTLDSLLKSHGTLSELSLSSIARQVLNGLEYLHSQKIVHRDIKPSNLLVNQKMEVKIADFGLSKMMSHNNTLQRCDSFVGTCAYMSPERLDQCTYDGYAADIWSFGLTLMELYVGHFPLLSIDQRSDMFTLMYAVCFEEPPSLPESASEEFQSFINCCLQKDSSKRWTVSQLLSHPFIARDLKIDHGKSSLELTRLEEGSNLNASSVVINDGTRSAKMQDVGVKLQIVRRINELKGKKMSSLVLVNSFNL